MCHYMAVKLIACLILIATACSGQIAERNDYWRTAYRWSVASLVAATTYDAASSVGGYEANRLLASSDGRYGAKGIAIKYGVAAGTLTAQYFVLRRHPERRKLAAVVNYTTAAAFAVIASRNLHVRNQPGYFTTQR